MSAPTLCNSINDQIQALINQAPDTMRSSTHLISIPSHPRMDYLTTPYHYPPYRNVFGSRRFSEGKDCLNWRLQRMGWWLVSEHPQRRGRAPVPPIGSAFKKHAPPQSASDHCLSVIDMHHASTSMGYGPSFSVRARLTLDQPAHSAGRGRRMKRKIGAKHSGGDVRQCLPSDQAIQQAGECLMAVPYLELVSSGHCIQGHSGCPSISICHLQIRDAFGANDQRPFPHC